MLLNLRESGGKEINPCLFEEKVIAGVGYVSNNEGAAGVCGNARVR